MGAALQSVAVSLTEQTKVFEDSFLKALIGNASLESMIKSFAIAEFAGMIGVSEDDVTSRLPAIE